MKKKERKRPPKEAINADVSDGRWLSGGEGPARIQKPSQDDTYLCLQLATFSPDMKRCIGNGSLSFIPRIFII